MSLAPVLANASTLQPFVNLLAWKASESNTAWASVSTLDSTHFTPNSISFNTRPGIQAGFSYLPEDCFFDSKLYWTYYSSSTSKVIPVGLHVVTSLFFSGSGFISEDLFAGASSSWDLKMNMIDLEVSHPFKPIPALTLRPNIGLKGGSINQQIDAEWNAILYTANEYVTNNFTGFGPTFGLDAKFNLLPNLSIIGDISTALMYGRWDLKDNYKRPLAFFGLIQPTSITTSLNQSEFGTMMMDYYLGLEWVYQGKSHIMLQLGYEMQYWANQLRLLSIQQFPTMGDLTIQGATCGITIDL